MPLPLIAAGVAIGAAVAGGTAGGGAGALKLRQAKRSIEEMQEELADVEALTAQMRNQCEASFAKLGETKVQAIDGALLPFHSSFGRIKNVELSVEVPGEGAPPIDEVRVSEAAKVTLTTADYLKGGSTVGVAAAVAPSAAFGAVGSMAAASTGTAIGTLSGAAATNATLAWLGGGSLAAGGGGVAAGTMVLGGIAAAPAFLVGGAFLFKKGREAIAKAEEYEADVQVALAGNRETQTILDACSGLAQRVQAVTERLIPLIAREVGWLDSRLDQESEWSEMSGEVQDRIRQLVILAIGLSDLVHTPLVDDDGRITTAIEDAYRQGLMVVGEIG